MTFNISKTCLAFVPRHSVIDPKNLECKVSVDGSLSTENITAKTKKCSTSMVRGEVPSLCGVIYAGTSAQFGERKLWCFFVFFC